MARKNMKHGINTQCSYQRKYEEYCGFHKTKRLRIDEPLPLNYKNYREAMAALPVYQGANENAQVIQQIKEGQDLSSEQDLDYLLTTLDSEESGAEE